MKTATNKMFMGWGYNPSVDQFLMIDGFELARLGSLIKKHGLTKITLATPGVKQNGELMALISSTDCYTGNNLLAFWNEATK